jgi:hypothetical protein
MLASVAVNGASADCNTKGVFALVSADSTPPDQKPLSQKVLVCTHQSDKVYHVDPNCSELMSCKRKVVEMTLEFASRKGKGTPCPVCVQK